MFGEHSHPTIGQYSNFMVISMKVEILWSYLLLVNPERRTLNPSTYDATLSFKEGSNEPGENIKYNGQNYHDGRKY